MAIAIVAFGLIAIASTLPVGLQSMRASETDQAVATIQNQLRGELQQISFVPLTNGECLTDLPNQKFYYTVEGVKTSTNVTMMPAYYQAEFGVTNGAVNGAGYDSSAISSPNNAAAVTVTLTYPFPTRSQTNVFTMFATKQRGD